MSGFNAGPYTITVADPNQPAAPDKLTDEQVSKLSWAERLNRARQFKQDPDRMPPWRNPRGEAR
jgi:hypothetical protein